MAQAVTYNPERLAEIGKLYSGGHSPNDDGAMCAMEAVAYIAGEPWSDHPQCACPVIAAFMRSWNDALPDDHVAEQLADMQSSVVANRADRAYRLRAESLPSDAGVR